MNAAPKGRLFCYSHSKLFVLLCLFIVLGISLALWIAGPPLSWIYDYDKERYTQIKRAIEADQQHLCGKSFDEVAEELSLQDVPWDDFNIQQGPDNQLRIYHFRGFALYVTLEILPAGITPQSKERWSSTMEELQRHGVLWIARHYQPFVSIDGISDGKERMKQHRKAVDEECERINAKMEKERQRMRKGR
ncbi:MAG: hypothetical protein ACLQNE_14990 [Thermoguttaceae bacterium]